MNIKRKFALALVTLGVTVSAVGFYPAISGDIGGPQSAPVITQTASPTATPTISVEPAPVVTPTYVGELRDVHVVIEGGQDVVDLGGGPVLFSLPEGYPPYIVEHDLYGGWERFGSLEKGMGVRMSGLVTGTYTVGQIINVPSSGTTSEFNAFTKEPKVMLQTCITGTDRMIIVGLY